MLEKPLFYCEIYLDGGNKLREENVLILICNIR